MIISIDTFSSPCSSMHARAASRICSRRAWRRSSVIRGMPPDYQKKKEYSLLTAPGAYGPLMFDHFAAYRPPTSRNLSARTRRLSIGAAAVTPALLIGVLGGTHSAAARDVPAPPVSTQSEAPRDSGL